MIETERLRAVAAQFGGFPEMQALFDGLAERHFDDGPPGHHYCRHDDALWPCPDVRAALAVADALGIQP